MDREYRIKEMVLTLQGEGAMAGTAVVLLRFEGCNLNCSFCDTDFTGTDGQGGGVFKTAAELVDAVSREWTSSSPVNVLCTGGEPLMQLDKTLVEEFKSRHFRILLETNGTISVPSGIDWICVSPKANTTRVQNSGDELKIVWPQEGINPGDYEGLKFSNFWIQPRFDSNYESNLQTSIEYCFANPKWRLSFQTHRFIGIP